MKLFQRIAPTLAAAMFLAGVILLVQENAGRATLYKWSQTASSNGNIDSTINFQEGQAPSSVNDSARAVMAAVAKYRDDMAGSATLGGGTTNYTLTTSQVFDTLAHLNGQRLCFVMPSTNAVSPFLAVDGLTSKPLRSAPSTDLGAGVLVSGSPYCAVYNNSNGEFYVEAFYGNPYNIPLGGVLAYTGSSAPNSNFVLAFGQAISRTTYATYFSQISTNYGTGDGVTTFNIPDLRGRAVAGLDNMGGSAASRMTNASTGCGVAFTSLASTTVCGAESTTLSAGNIPSGITVTGTVSTPTITTNIRSMASLAAGAFNYAVTNDIAGGTSGNVSSSSIPTFSGTGCSNCSGTAFSKVQPTIGLNYLLRVF